MLKVSIITVCYNSADTIEPTIQSVINQTYPNIEYIIVDGLSKDNTLDIVNKYSNKISKIISEKDDGLYYAINKGIDLCTGDIIGIIHADDLYIDNNVIQIVVNLFESSKTETIYADLQYVDRENINKIIRYWKSGKYKDGLFKKGWMPPHPTFFVKADCYKKYGKFATTLKSAADYELMLRLLHKHKCTTAYLPQVIVKMRIGGKSNVSFKNRLKANREDRQAWLMNGLTPGLFTMIRKPLSKLTQFLKK